MLDYGSSLLDLAVFIEQQAGRKVYLDFLRNPEPVNAGETFSLDNLDPDVREYLENNDALQDLPIDRLRRMNPLAIELYRMHGTDLASEPLEFAMNNQHMNGGILIDDWGRTNLGGCYAIGEAAGSHGVTRPGGAALNSGQVFGKRVALAIKRSRNDKTDTVVDQGAVSSALAGALRDADGFVSGSGRKPKDVKAEVQARMSDYAGIICTADEVRSALQSATALRREVESNGLEASSAAMVGQAFRWRHMVWVSEAVLTALDHYISAGGGSRGARAICSKAGTRCPDASIADLSHFRFIEEQANDQEAKLIVGRSAEGITIRSQPVNRDAQVHREFFEKGWGSYLIEEG